MKTGDLIAEDMRKKSDRLFITLIACLTIYFVVYLFITGFVTNGDYVMYINVSCNVFNIMFNFTALLLYFYTIMMLRNAINQCASFQFDVRGTYIICGLYGFILLLQIFYLFSYNFIKNSLISVALLHFVSYLCYQITIYWTLQKTGSGLRLVPHKLNNN